MFKAVVETDKYGKNQKHYYLTQGDSATIYSKPYKNGELVDISLVDNCVFKLSDSDYKQEFSKVLELDSVNGRFVLNLTSEETTNFLVDQHFYEIQYTLIGGEVQTSNSWKFDIVDQIVE